MQESDAVAAIVLAHPYSILRNLRACEISYKDRTAVIDAAISETAAQSMTENAAMQYLLAATERIAREVPRDRWKFIPHPWRFFQEKCYRLEPAYFCGQQEQRPCQAGFVSNQEMAPEVVEELRVRLAAKGVRL